MTHNIFEVQKRLRQLHNPLLAQAHIRWLIAEEDAPKSAWTAQLLALQNAIVRKQLRRENREDRKQA